MRALRLPWQARGRVLLTLDPDVVPSALLAARLRRRRLVADVHEDYVALLLDRAWAARARRSLQAMAAWCVALAGKASLTVVADDHVPPASVRCRQRLVVRNLPDLQLLPAPPAVGRDRPVGERSDEPLRAAYIGDVRTSRGLRAMIDAVAAAPGWRLDVVGPVAASDEDWLAARLLADDVLDTAGGLRVHLHGRLPPQQAWQVAADASVGMLLVGDTPAFREAVPSKLYEYLAMGLAVLATPLPRVVPFIADSGAGAVVDGAEAAAAQLRTWSGQPEALAQARRAALDWSQQNLRGVSPWDELAAQVVLLAR